MSLVQLVEFRRATVHKVPGQALRAAFDPVLSKTSWVAWLAKERITGLNIMDTVIHYKQWLVFEYGRQTSARCNLDPQVKRCHRKPK